MRDDYQSGYDNQGYHDPYEQPMQQDKPLDPAVERVRRKLMRLMIFSVAITMLLIVAVLIAVIYKVMSPASDQTPATAIQAEQQIPSAPAEAVPSVPIIPEVINRAVALPQGTRILSQSLSGDLIALETLTPEGKTELVIYDYKQGHLIAGITLQTTPDIQQPADEPVPTTPDE
ncbi:hypothetical protein [Bartonella sp. LJL80]